MPHRDFQAAKCCSPHHSHNALKFLELAKRKLRRRRRVLMFGPAASALPVEARNLIRNPDFRKAFLEASEFVEARRGWSLWNELDNDAPPSGITSSERNFVQEVALQLSLFRAIQAAGVEFDVVAGISLGDAAAGHAAGALTFEETLHVMCETIRAVLCAGGGDLVLVQGAPARIREIIQQPEIEMIFDWSIQSVWAVPDEHARKFRRTLRVARVPYKALNFNCLSHTERVDVEGMTNALSALLETKQLNQVLYSTHEGGLVREAPRPERWAKSISEQVRLDDMWRVMLEAGDTDVIYIGSVPGDRDLFNGLSPEQRPTSYVAAEQLIAMPESGNDVSAAVHTKQEPTDVATILRSASFARDPYRYYGRWLNEGPVHKFDGESYYLVVGYDAALHVLTHPAEFSSSPFNTLSPVLPGADAPLHTRVRRALGPHFSRDSVLARKDRVTAIVNGTVESMRSRKKFDASIDFALPLTFAVWCDSLGLHQEHAAAVAPLRTSDATWQDVDFALNGEGILADVLARDELPVDDIAKLLPFMIGAGTLTMRDTVCCSILTLLRDRELLAGLVADPSLVSGFVDELLRYEPGIHGVPRRAVSDTVVADVEIPRDSILWVSIGAAHRDPTRFSNPDDFRIGRAEGKNIAFGAGPHYCLGSHLGRLEAEVILSAILPALPRLRATGAPDFMFTDMRDDNPTYPFMRAMKSWQLAFTSR